MSSPILYMQVEVIRRSPSEDVEATYVYIICTVTCNCALRLVDNKFCTYIILYLFKYSKPYSIHL